MAIQFLIAFDILATGLTACALSVKAYGFASSPKGRAKSTAESFPAARLFPQETSATAAVHRYDPTREKGVLKSPQAFQNPKIKIFFR